MKIELSLYGACRDLHRGPLLQVDLRDGSRVGDLRRVLPEHLGLDDPTRARALIGASAFATDDDVLRDSDPLPPDGRLAILPPVSGG